jgi:hypothetical protein
MDFEGSNIEGAYVNYLKALTIVVEVIPKHKDWREIQERRTERSIEYWLIRKVIYFKSTWKD